MLDNQLERLQRWHIPAKKVGRDIGVKGMDDEHQIVPMIRTFARITFFTHDLGFCGSKFCHERYCIVVLRVDRYKAADYIRRFLKHPEFQTHNQRLGWVFEVYPTFIKGWRVGKNGEKTFRWY
ncbi:hypothetical protein HUU05_08335 [candidate division KSB1 bacterium]|nr:hypothetical protein [candidate division KSB1 bacterium]